MKTNRKNPQVKTYLKILGLIILIVTLIGCSEEPPSFRVKNDRSQKANVQIKTVNNTVNLNDVQSGSVTNYQDVAEGKVEITAGIQNEDVSPTGSFSASNDYNYTIIIVNSTPPTIRVDSSDK